MSEKEALPDASEEEKMVAVMESGLALQLEPEASPWLELCTVGRVWRGFAHPLSCVREPLS